jgi:MFS family permease
VLLFCFFALAGAYDVGINTAGMHVEQRRGRRAMPLLHAGYSGGAAVGAIGTGTLLHLGVPFRPLFVLGAAVPAVVAALVFVRRRLFVGAHPAAHPIEPPGAEPQGALRSDTVHRSVPQAARPFRSPTIWLLALITGLCFFGEGSVETWSALYLSQVLGAAVLIGAAGPAVFHTAMFVGRLLSAATVARFGPYATLRGAGVLCAAGMALALGTDSIVATLAGFLVTGLALAAIAPQAFSIAGDHAGGRGGEASSLITMVGYGGFLFGPALIGGLSEAFGLRIALAALIAAGAGIGVLAFALHGAVRPAVRAAAE